MKKELVINAHVGEWNRLVVVPQNIPPFVSCEGMIGQEVVEHMIEKYVSQDGQLQGIDLYNFCNWCMNFWNLNFHSDRCVVQVEELTTSEIQNLLRDIEKIKEH